MTVYINGGAASDYSSADKISYNNTTSGLVATNVNTAIDEVAGGGGGGSGIGSFDATVGVAGADYATIGAAVTAGKNNLLVIANTTEVADITTSLTADLYIHIQPGITVDLSTFQFIAGAGSRKIVFSGSGTLTGAPSVSMFSALNLPVIEASGITITNTSTVATTRRIIPSNIEFHFNNVTINLPNKAQNGIQNNITGSYIANSTINGGGALCSKGLETISKGSFYNIIFGGTWDVSAGIYAIQVTGPDVVFDNIKWFGTNNVNFMIGGKWNGLVGDGTASINLLLNQSDSIFSNFEIGSGQFDFSTYDRCQITNLLTTDVLLFNVNGTKHKISNSSFRSAGAITISAKGCIFHGCEFLSGTIISGDDNSLIGCVAGDTDVPGGVPTFTINAGTNRTIVSACRTDSIIVNNGTASVISGSVEF